MHALHIVNYVSYYTPCIILYIYSHALNFTIVFECAWALHDILMVNLYSDTRRIKISCASSLIHGYSQSYSQFHAMIFQR